MKSRLEVTLVEAGPRILPALPDRLAEAAQHELEALGVRVLTEMAVTEATARRDCHPLGRTRSSPT